MTIDTKALLPCPFCGGKAAIAQPIDGAYCAECSDCMASSALRYSCGDEPVPLVAEAWNSRHAADRLAALEAMNRAMEGTLDTVAKLVGVTVPDPGALILAVEALQAELTRVRELCPEVLAFAHLMQRKLDANAHKDGQGWDRDGTGKRGWKNCDVSFLRGKLTDEVVELIVAIREPTNHDNVAEEAADVGNIAMMLADVCGALSQPAEQPQREGE